MARPYKPYYYRRNRMVRKRHRKRPIKRRRRPGQRRTMRRFKQRQVYIGRRLARIPRPIAAKFPNFKYMVTTNSLIYSINAHTEFNKPASPADTAGILDISTTLGTIMNAAQVDQIKNYGYYNILNIVYRLQLCDIKYSCIKCPPITVPTNTYLNSATQITGLSSNAGTPKLWFRLQMLADIISPVGGTTGANLESSLTAAEQQWTECPRTKSLYGRKPASAYWTQSSSMRGRKEATSGLSISSVIGSSIPGAGNQLPGSITVFWSDFNRYLYNSAADATSLKIMLTGRALVKLSDNIQYSNAS